MLFGYKIFIPQFLFDCTKEKKGNKCLGTEHQCLCKRGQNRCNLGSAGLALVFYNSYCSSCIFYACQIEYQWLELSLASIVLMVNFLKWSNTEIKKKRNAM